MSKRKHIEDKRFSDRSSKIRRKAISLDSNCLTTATDSGTKTFVKSNITSELTNKSEGSKKKMNQKKRI